MTKKLFFDTDCFSSFLWVNQEHLLLRLYPGRIIIPNEVSAELSNPCIPHIKRKMNYMSSLGQLEKKQIVNGSEESKLFYDMVTNPDKNVVPIGKGEAAALALAKVYKGVVASNNIKDICYYVGKWDLDFITSAEILVEAKCMSLIDECEGNKIWLDMLAKKRSLPADSFTEYIEHIRKS